ncbi:MAG: phosphate ABC transporter permease subunit PstC [Armatimonadota bacterium]|nr:MAG: phosphate ABC transporter permease subunit PstC [Armatimonadota bacterium]
MSSTDATGHSLQRRGVFGANVGDRAFRWCLLIFAATVLGLIVVLAYELSRASLPAIRQFGWRFIVSSTWDPVHRVFGALPFIYGTLVSSLLALLIAVPISLGTALFLAELAPRWLRGPVSFLVELLAAVPSVVYGLWGIFVLVPLLRPVEAWLGQHLGVVPLFRGPAYGIGMLAAGLVLAIMVIPFITAVSREVLQSVPVSQREAAYALGATRWEAMRGPVLRYARAGILGGVMLGLGRAVGETMAVTMVIGNRPDISASLFSPGYTLASALANEFLEATVEVHTSALLELALILFAITIVINIVARLMLWSVSRGTTMGVRE